MFLPQADLRVLQCVGWILHQKWQKPATNPDQAESLLNHMIHKVVLDMQKPADFSEIDAVFVLHSRARPL